MSNKPRFQNFTCAEDYIKSGVKWCEPMLAKELTEDEDKDKCLTSPDYIIEEKFDGTRATLHFYVDKNGKGYTRLFSRRVSEKTGWFCENSDLCPHIRDLDVPELAGVIIDGEMFIPDRPFKDVASTLNCGYEKAIARQEELGKIVFHAFDILYHDDIKIENMPLHRRKEYLSEVIAEINSPYVEEVKYYPCNKKVPVQIKGRIQHLYEKETVFETLCHELHKLDHGNNPFISPVPLSPKAYYEYIVATGGEGVIVKPINGKYLHARGWEYSKIKKFLTREVIIIGYADPTDDYKGKTPTPEKWPYWETSEHDFYDLTDCTPKEIARFKANWYPAECRPISKFYYNQWIGNIQFGVVITEEEIAKLPKNKKFNIFTCNFFSGGEEKKVIEVGECSGFDEEVREYITNHKAELMGSVIEVKANELFKDTGKLRHPRFLRFRQDKAAIECTWHDHITAGE